MKWGYPYDMQLPDRSNDFKACAANHESDVLNFAMDVPCLFTEFLTADRGSVINHDNYKHQMIDFTGIYHK